jgi:CheY-like chemotaxis protein
MSQSKTARFKRVLLVDDNDIDNFINERIITSSFFADKVVVKTSARAALDFLRDNVSNPETLPEVIFLDLNMPVMDGFAFLEEYKNIPDSAKGACKIVVLSSSISPEDINKAFTNPLVKKYLNKPLAEKYLEAINF